VLHGQFDLALRGFGSRRPEHLAAQSRTFPLAALDLRFQRAIGTALRAHIKIDRRLVDGSG